MNIKGLGIIPTIFPFGLSYESIIETLNNNNFFHQIEMFERLFKDNENALLYIDSLYIEDLNDFCKEILLKLDEEGEK